MLIQPDGSGRPLLSASVPTPGDAGTIEKFVRRFDPGGGTWSAPLDVPAPPSFDLDRQLAVDAAGNAHSFWRNAAGNYWSWWRAGSAIVSGPGQYWRARRSAVRAMAGC